MLRWEAKQVMCIPFYYAGPTPKAASKARLFPENKENQLQGSTLDQLRL